MPNTMHGLKSNSPNIPAFILKLWKFVEDHSCNDIIAWTDTGLSFIIKDRARFSTEILPQYFKHNKIESFIRQLHNYGFQTVKNYDKSGLENECDEMEYYHNYFQKEKISLLNFIKRKHKKTQMDEISTSEIDDVQVAEANIPAICMKSNAKDILSDLTLIKEKQKNIDNLLVKIKQENKLLWHEVVDMKKNYKIQEQMMQMVMQLLLTTVQRVSQNLPVKKNIPCILPDSSGSEEKSQVTKKTNESQNILKKLLPVPLVSILKPVIHRISSSEHEQKDSCISPAINSLVDESATVEHLNSLQPSTSCVNAVDITSKESVPDIPSEYTVNVLSDDAIENVISIPEEPTDVTFIFPCEPPQTSEISVIHLKDDDCPSSPFASLNFEMIDDVNTKPNSVNTQQNDHYHPFPGVEDLNMSSLRLNQNTLPDIEDFNWLQDEIVPWNIEANEAETICKIESSDTDGNEPNQFSPSVLHDIQNHLSMCLNEVTGMVAKNSVENFAEDEFLRSLDLLTDEKHAEYQQRIESLYLKSPHHSKTQELKCHSQDSGVVKNSAHKNSGEQEIFLSVNILHDSNDENVEYKQSSSSSELKSSCHPEIQKLRFHNHDPGIVFRNSANKIQSLSVDVMNRADEKNVKCHQNAGSSKLELPPPSKTQKMETFSQDQGTSIINFADENSGEQKYIISLSTLHGTDEKTSKHQSSSKSDPKTLLHSKMQILQKAKKRKKNE